MIPLIYLLFAYFISYQADIVLLFSVKRTTLQYDSILVF